MSFDVCFRDVIAYVISAPFYWSVCLWMSIAVNFNITSWKSCENTDSRKLAKAIDGALEDLKTLLEKKHASNGAMNQRKGWVSHQMATALRRD